MRRKIKTLIATLITIIILASCSPDSNAIGETPKINTTISFNELSKEEKEEKAKAFALASIGAMNTMSTPRSDTQEYTWKTKDGSINGSFSGSFEKGFESKLKAESYETDGLRVWAEQSLKITYYPFAMNFQVNSVIEEIDSSEVYSFTLLQEDGRTLMQINGEDVIDIDSSYFTFENNKLTVK